MAQFERTSIDEALLQEDPVAYREDIPLLIGRRRGRPPLRASTYTIRDRIIVGLFILVGLALLISGIVILSQGYSNRFEDDCRALHEDEELVQKCIEENKNKKKTTGGILLGLCPFPFLFAWGYHRMRPFTFRERWPVVSIRS